MLEERRLLARYSVVALAIAGGLEWLLGRTISRLAAAPPLEGIARTIVEALGRVGLFLVSPSFLLAALLLLLACFSIGAQRPTGRPSADLALSLYLAVFVAVVAAHTFMPTATWLNIAFNILSFIAVCWIAARFVLNSEWPPAARVAVVLVAIAYTGWYFYVVQQLTVDAGAGQGDLGVWALSAGELPAVLAPFAFFAAIAVPGREWRHLKRWVLPVLLALIVTGGSISDTVFNQGFTGVLATWSLGFNIIWPWPLYAVSIALFSYALLTCLVSPTGRGNYGTPDVGVGLLFLLLAGYNMQIPYQHLLAVLAMLMMTRLFEPLGGVAIERRNQRGRTALRGSGESAPERGRP